MSPGCPLSPSGFVVLDPTGRRGRVKKTRKGRCTWCGCSVKPPRRTWCSQDCVSMYQATQPDTLARAVWERDQGVCIDCGVDCEQLASRLRTNPQESNHLLQAGVPKHQVNILLVKAYRKHRLWEVEHSMPIWMGGHPFEMANLVTRCYVCHKEKSKLEATERAKVKRAL